MPRLLGSFAVRDDAAARSPSAISGPRRHAPRGTRRRDRRRSRGAPALLALLAGGAIRTAAAQVPLPRPTPAAGEPPAREVPTPWYSTFQIRGYGQFRYNRLFESNPDLQCEQCDRSWGNNAGIGIRRARLIVQGQIHPRVFLYLQPDFASTVGTALNTGQLRDWYADVGLDADNELRVRVGQSKIPYSFEAMQSSQHRLPLDRADGTNSAHVNERDLGVFLYWAPRPVRELLRHLVQDGLKGSGDYGTLALGVFNGQGLNRPEANNTLHVAARAAWPLVLRGQVIEPGIAAYGGRYVLPAELRSAGVKGARDWSYRDDRVLASLYLAPQPFGLLAEWNVGRGPEFNPVTDSIETRRLHGGFVTASWRLRHGGQVFHPFVRWQAYDGGKKHERDARRYVVRDVEFGVEWQPWPAFELVAEWYQGDRRFEDFLRQDNRQVGHLLRLHAQVNY